MFGILINIILGCIIAASITGLLYVWVGRAYVEEDLLFRIIWAVKRLFR